MKKLIVIAMAAVMAFASVESINAAEISANTENSIQDKKKTAVQTVTFKCPGMHCANCAKKVTENISFEKGVKDLEVSVENKTVKVSYDSNKTSVEKLQEALRKIGYSSEVIQ